MKEIKNQKDFKKIKSSITGQAVVTGHAIIKEGKVYTLFRDGVNQVITTSDANKHEDVPSILKDAIYSRCM